MPYTFRIEERLVVVRWCSVVSSADLRSIDRELSRMAETMRDAPDVLHLFEHVAGYSFSPTLVLLVSLLRRRIVIPRPVRSALVVPSRAGQPIARLFRQLNRTRNLTLEVFATEAAARLWLAAPRSEPTTARRERRPEG